MAYRIDHRCISCGVCTFQCPVDCIAQGKDHYEIDADLCIDCGECQDICPVDAISVDDDTP